MPHIGLPELIIILVIALIVFGAGKLPSVGRALGQSIREFKEAKEGAAASKGSDDGESRASSREG